MLPKSVLKKIAVELRAKTDEQLNELLFMYSNKLENLSDKDYDYLSTSLKQKIELVKSEIYIRETLNSKQI